MKNSDNDEGIVEAVALQGAGCISYIVITIIGLFVLAVLAEGLQWWLK